MNFKTTFILLVLVVAGAALWIVTGRKPAETATQPEVKTDNKPRYVFDPRPERDAIVKVTFERAGKPTLVFERDPDAKRPGPDTWRMVEPLESPTESYLVDGLATTVTSLQYKRVVTSGAGGVSPQDAGLDPPAATLTIHTRDDKDFALEIGKRVALSNDMYVRIAGDQRIFIIARDLTRDIDRKVNDYRAKSLIRLSASDARHVEITHGGKTYDFTRNDAGEWVINQPVRAYARPQKLTGIINGLGSVRVKEFVDDAPTSLEPYGLDTPWLSIRVTTEKKEKVENNKQGEDENQSATQPSEPEFRTVTKTHALLVGGWADLESTARYAKLADQPWVVSLTKQQVEKLVPKLDDLRDPRVLRAKRNQIDRIELTAGGQRAVLTRTDGTWHGDGDLAQLDTDAVEKLLDALEDLHAIDFVDDPEEPAAYGLDEPRALLRLSVAGDVEPITLRIGKNTPSGRNTYVQVSGQPSIMVISAARARDIAPQPLALRSRTITDFEPGRIRRIDLTRGEKHYVLARDEGGPWRLLEPPDAPPDPASTRELANDLARLRARQVVARDAFAQYGLDQPAVTIRFAATPRIEGPPASASSPASAPAASAPATQVAPVEHTLLVVQRGPRTFARYDDLPYVFELDKTVYDVFTQELIRRGLFDITADDVRDLRIEAPGGTVEFRREDGNWVYPPDPTVKLSQKKVGDFVKQLAALRATAYLAYREGDLEQQGLADAPVTVTIGLKDDRTITLKVAQVRRGELPRKAAWVEQRRVFLLTPGEAQSLMRGLDYYAVPDPTGDAKAKTGSRPGPRPPRP